MLNHVPYIVALVLVFLVGNILCWMPQGPMRDQLLSIQNTRTERRFGTDDSRFSLGRMALLCQWFVLFGVQLYLYVGDEAVENLISPNAAMLAQLLSCMLVPVAWYALQWFFMHWWGFIFNLGKNVQIISRIYRSAHMLAGTLAMLVFLLQICYAIDAETGMILLSLIFICAQIIFIFSGIKIFYRGLSSLFVIFLYLCALKVAPLLVLWQKMID